MSPAGRRAAALVGSLALLVLVAACSGSGDDDDGASADGSTAASSVTAEPTSSLVASTLRSSTTDEPPTTVSSAPATSASTTASSSSTASAPTTTSIEVLVIDGPLHDFTSPSGNIACAMNEAVVSCWIGEKSWTIDQPDGPDCAVSDWGNAVDLGLEGPTFPCYTDLAWDLFAPPLPYGNAVELGPFRCTSAETGVTCRNGDGNGFTVSRSSVQLF